MQGEIVHFDKEFWKKRRWHRKHREKERKEEARRKDRVALGETAGSRREEKREKFGRKRRILIAFPKAA